MVRIKSIVDILAWVAALLGFVPLFPHVGTVPRIAFGLALVCSVLTARGRQAFGGRVATFVSLAFFLYYLARFDRHNVVGPSADLLVVFLAVRLAGEKNARHYLQIFALSLFCLAASSLFSLSSLFLVYLLLFALLIGTALVILTFYANDTEFAVTPPVLRKIVAVALLLPLGSLPLMAFFFFLLPRTQYPLWEFLNTAVVQQTSFSDKVRPGSAASTAETGSIAFRANAPFLTPDRLYWRGIVLNSFEGDAWVRRDPPAGELAAPEKGDTVVQTIYPEPGSSTYLIALNAPRQIRGIRERASADLVHNRVSAASGRGKYEAVSMVGDALEVPGGIDRDFYLRLPRKLSARMFNLGREAAGLGSDEEKIGRIESFFVRGGFYYATTGMPVSSDPLDDFLFRTKRGNCEFFASSLALLLRAAGIPARLVGGYLGGDYNELGGYYVVTSDMAHVWVEAYVTGKGWVTFDPSSWAVNAASLREKPARTGVSRLRLSLDALNHYWNMAVINYDLDQQLQMFNRASGDLRRIGAFHPPSVRRSLPFLALFLVASAILMVWRRPGQSVEERLVSEFGRRLAGKTGRPYDPSLGLYEVAAGLDVPEAERFAQIYGGAVYRDRRLTAEEVAELKTLLARIDGNGRKGV
jgi:protein-glutamine gamma-glutamyltransferase